MIGSVIVALGLFLVWIGAIGMLRFRSPYCRLQVSGVADTGGAILFLLGLIAYSGWSATGGIMIVLILFLLFTTPLGTHTIAKSAFIRRLKE